MPPFKPTTPDAFGINPDVIKKPDSFLLKEEMEFLDTPELAKALDIEEKVVRRMIDRRAITTYRVSGKILFRRTDVLKYLNNKEQPRPIKESIPSHAMINPVPGRDWWPTHDDFDDLCDLIGYVLERSPKDPTIRWVFLEGKEGSILLVQRIYRDGIGCIKNPTEEIVERYRANPWMAWNEAKILRF